MSPQMSSILALIPAYNEATHIGTVVNVACQYLPVLVVDDGSRDETATLAESAGARVLRQQPNAGKGAALRAGFRHAVEAGFNAVVTLDADGQHDPHEIPTFLQAFQETGADLIIGERDFRRIPPVRRVSNTIGRISFSWALGQNIPDNQSGYRLISRRLMQAMLAEKKAGFQMEGFQFEVEMIVRCTQLNYPISGVPIRTIYADERSHIRPLQHIIEFARMLLRTRRVMREHEGR